MRLQERMRISAEPPAVFGLVSDPSRFPEFFVGLTRWERRSRRARGVGARYRILVQVGSIEAGGVVRISAWRPGELIEWRSETGIEQRGRWVVVPDGDGTDLRLEIDYRLVGPLAGLVEWLVARVLRRHMAATLLAARRLLEAPGPREPARRARKGATHEPAR